MPWNLERDSSYCEGFFCDVCNSPSLIFFLATMTHNMTAREDFALFGSFLNFLCSFQTIFKTAGMKILYPGRSFAKLALDLWWNSMFWTQKRFLQKILSIISYTCSSNLAGLLPIRQEFVFFMRGGRKGSRYTGWEIIHLRWSSIFEKCVGTNVKL